MTTIHAKLKRNDMIKVIEINGVTHVKNTDTGLTVSVYNTDGKITGCVWDWKTDFESDDLETITFASMQEAVERAKEIVK